MKCCIRCGREEKIEKHHIKQRIYGGGDEPENIEYRCDPCHDYEHARRKLLEKSEREIKRGQPDRIRAYEHRLEVLDRLNTPELIRERGTYVSYWTDESTHEIPPKLSKAKLEASKLQLGFWD